MAAQNKHLVIVDWGTTSLRATLLDSDGEILDSYESSEGIAVVAPTNAFAPTLQHILDKWREPGVVLSLYASGMIGSRNGWIEVPYVTLPADAKQLAAGVRRVEVSPGVTLTILPGAIDNAKHVFPDVMRGEETQLVGLGLDKDATAILPGTHSKWARIEGGKITKFQTFLTGELYGTLIDHSFVASIAKPAAARQDRAFARGLEAAARGPHSGGVMAKLFSARTGWLSGQLEATDIRDYLSGLVIGSEFAEAREMGWLSKGETLTLIGRPDLAQNYKLAAEAFGAQVVIGPTDAALRGCLAIARLAQGVD
jgi:2-dehydro-3-deoxygalactonokinase